MKKILYVIGQLGVGGAEHQLIYLTTNLDPTKYEIMVCSLSKEAQLLPLLEDAGLKTIIIPKLVSPDFTRPFKLLKIVKSFKPDLIHSYLSVANTWSRLVGFVTGVPVIISERSCGQNNNFIIRVFNKILSFSGDYIIANSQAGANGLIENDEFSSEKVKTIYNGVFPKRFQLTLDDQDKQRLLLDLGISDCKNVIGIIGRFDSNKNHDLLFKAFQIVLRRFPSSCILCIGDGPRREELKRLASSLGITEHVYFTGIREDIPECLALMKLLVLPSFVEGLPNVILEAMAANVPVVATDVGGVGELINEGVTGWLVNPEDELGLAEKISYVLEYPKNAEIVAENAHHFVTKHFSIERMVQETEKVYSELLDGKA